MNPLNPNDEPQAPWLKDALQNLPREMEPERDLWPQIAQKLDRKPRAWLGAAIAASVLISAGSAFFTWQIWESRSADKAALIAAQTAIENIRTPFEAARVSYQQQLPALLQGLDPKTAEQVKHNFEVIEKANAEIAKALHKDPNDPALRGLMLKTYEQELSLYQKLQKFAIGTI